MLTLNILDTLCGGITISSDVIAYDDVTIASIEITTKINCCSTETTYTITDFITPDTLLVDNAGTLEIHLLPAFFTQTDSLSDGIYSINIKVIKEDTSYIEEIGCIFINCYIKCKLIDLIASGDYESHRLFDAIIAANNCVSTDCDCASACNLFEQLVTNLNLSTTTNENIISCGCS